MNNPKTELRVRGVSLILLTLRTLFILLLMAVFFILPELHYAKSQSELNWGVMLFLSAFAGYGVLIILAILKKPFYYILFICDCIIIFVALGGYRYLYFDPTYLILLVPYFLYFGFLLLRKLLPSKPKNQPEHGTDMLNDNQDQQEHSDV